MANQLWVFQVHNIILILIRGESGLTSSRPPHPVVLSVSSVELWLISVCFGAEGSLEVSPLTFSFSVNNWSAFIQSELQEWNPIQGLQMRRRRRRSQCSYVLFTFNTHMKIKKTLQRSEGFTLRSFVFKLYFCYIILHKYSPFIQLQLISFLYHYILMSR